jgi:hypothetical protein
MKSHEADACCASPTTIEQLSNSLLLASPQLQLPWWLQVTSVGAAALLECVQTCKALVSVNLLDCNLFEPAEPVRVPHLARRRGRKSTGGGKKGKKGSKSKGSKGKKGKASENGARDASQLAGVPSTPLRDFLF